MINHEPLTRSNTLVLFGRSPFINEIKNDIPNIISRFHTMGCNYFVDTFPDVEYVIFFDDIVPKVTERNIIVTNIRHLREPRKKCQKLCLKYKDKAEFYEILANRRSDFSQKAGRLHFYLHTPSMAFNWAWQKGFKNVVIAGIDLNINSIGHFDASSTPDQDDCTLKDNTMYNARWHIDNVVSRFLKVYQLNPNNTMNVDKITMKELMAIQ